MENSQVLMEIKELEQQFKVESEGDRDFLKMCDIKSQIHELKKSAGLVGIPGKEEDCIMCSG